MNNRMMLDNIKMEENNEINEIGNINLKIKQRKN